MELEVVRRYFNKHNVEGTLFVNGQRECFTLEDIEREVKVPGETCIPIGRYKVIITLSHRFGKWMPELVGVPNFSGIRIHCGNTDADTHGCILLGHDRTDDGIQGSHIAFDPFYTKLKAALDRGEEAWITIRHYTGEGDASNT